MELLVLSLTQWLDWAWELLLRWEGPLRAVTSYATFAGVVWTMIKVARSNQRVAIVAVNADTGTERLVATLPRHQVCRSEVLGLLRLEAGGSQLDNRCFRWDDKFRREVRAHLPQASFDLLRSPPE